MVKTTHAAAFCQISVKYNMLVSGRLKRPKDPA